VESTGVSHSEYDVAVVGASIAGCTAAVLFARRGLQVALIEQRESPESYKKACTHYIQNSATPTIKRLGIDHAIEESGGIRNGIEMWTRRGWIRGDSDHYGYNIRRQKLDPMLRNLAIKTPGVNYFSGLEARDLILNGGQVCGVRAYSRGNGNMDDITAKLVVGADGHYSRIGQVSGLPIAVKPNNRFAYYAYYRNITLDSGRKSQFWLLEPDMDCAYAFPNDDGLTLLASAPVKSKLPRYKKALEGTFNEVFGSLPNGPNIKDVERVSEFRGIIDIPNNSRAVSRPGLALIGDAAIGSDPLWGVGCGWAFQSAEWLVDFVADALIEKSDVELARALERYRKKHRSTLGSHHSIISSFSTGRPFNMIEKLIFSASVKDETTRRHFEEFGSRRITPRQFLTPSTLARAMWVSIKS
jgi:flavin-dependent dehydrogenase